MAKPQTMNKKVQEGTVTSQQNDVIQLLVLVVVETEMLRKRVLQIPVQAEHTCKIYLDCESGVVILPCGHICYCKSCGCVLRTGRCPLCPVPVQLKEIVELKIFKS